MPSILTGSRQVGRYLLCRRRHPHKEKRTFDWGQRASLYDPLTPVFTCLRALLRGFVCHLCGPLGGGLFCSGRSTSLVLLAERDSAGKRWIDSTKVVLRSFSAIVKLIYSHCWFLIACGQVAMGGCGPLLSRSGWKFESLQKAWTADDEMYDSFQAKRI